MVLKRGFSSSEKENDHLHPQPTQQPSTQRLKYTTCQSKDELCLQSYSAQLENLIRKVVREEVEHAIQHSYHSISRSLPIQPKSCETRKFKLQFEGKLPQKLFTGNKVEAEDCTPIKLFLLDAITGHRVTDTPLSSSKVKLVVLHGHFKAEELENWTKKEFNNNIVYERDGKRPLLVGQHVVIVLENGIGCIGDVCFTDNSSWERSKMFRLGAKVEAKQDEVMEAVSNPFEVKDRRGENYKKHDIPSLEDDVWRLCWIAKDGKICKRLAEHHIYKVKDFLTQYYLDESLLRQILNVSPKKWEAIIQGATACFSDNNTRILCHSAPIDIPATCHDQQEIKMWDSLLEEHIRQLDQSLTLNDPLLMDILAGSCSNNYHSCMDNSMLPSFPSKFDFETSTWFPVADSEGNSYCNSNIRMLSSLPDESVNASEPANPKEGWGKVRAFWKILVKHDEAAIKKGKFPCYCQ